ncbi:MAG TPA: hypothetical protein PKA64_21245, partial [Myxococcota bacterium]|nr:hypothetical protein [Myxococcota bacterium]
MVKGLMGLLWLVAGCVSSSSGVDDKSVCVGDECTSDDVDTDQGADSDEDSETQETPLPIDSTPFDTGEPGGPGGGPGGGP